MCPDAAEDGSPCAKCPAVRMEVALQSAMGARMRSAFDLDFALGRRIHIGLDEISAHEFRALKVIELERRRFQEEENERRQKEAAAKRGKR
jgi:hypothetical protein